MYTKLFTLLICFLLLSGCTLLSSIKPDPPPPPTQQTNTNTQYQDSLEDVITDTDQLIVTIQNGNLVITNIANGKSIPVYGFTDSIPTSKQFEEFLISPSSKYITWYSPLSGINVLDIDTKQKEVIYSASSFLNINPFVTYVEDADQLAFVSNDGNTFNIYDITAQTTNTIPIPYPYGNQFVISPDQQHVFFIAGYSQIVDKPEFMFTDIKGKFKNQITTDTDPADRDLVVWAPDSNGVILVDQDSLVLYPLINPEDPIRLFTVPDNYHITDISRIDDKIYIFTEGEYWHIYDYTLEKEVARTPSSIAVELNRPRFIPVGQNQMMIEETLTDSDIQFKRLWLSDFKGKKHILVERYQEVRINTQPLIVN